MISLLNDIIAHWYHCSLITAHWYHHSDITAHWYHHSLVSLLTDITTHRRHWTLLLTDIDGEVGDENIPCIVGSHLHHKQLVLESLRNTSNGHVSHVTVMWHHVTVMWHAVVILTISTTFKSSFKKDPCLWRLWNRWQSSSYCIVYVKSNLTRPLHTLCINDVTLCNLKLTLPKMWTKWLHMASTKQWSWPFSDNSFNMPATTFCNNRQQVHNLIIHIGFMDEEKFVVYPGNI